MQDWGGRNTKVNDARRASIRKALPNLAQMHKLCQHICLQVALPPEFVPLVLKLRDNIRALPWSTSRISAACLPMRSRASWLHFDSSSTEISGTNHLNSLRRSLVH
jgi:hypothetical protein